MAEFKFSVIETRTYDVQYTVEADNIDEAHEMAERGETTFEVTLGMGGVTDRTVDHVITD